MIEGGFLMQRIRFHDAKTFIAQLNQRLNIKSLISGSKGKSKCWRKHVILFLPERRILYVCVSTKRQIRSIFAVLQIKAPV